ncbi:MAG: hypothetical protein D3922_02620 [Candidatus Electrothrix sp. AR1]|nr:hypothetical protein [Candidatus Electrothrix sp. AR1]
MNRVALSRVTNRIVFAPPLLAVVGNQDAAKKGLFQEGRKKKQGKEGDAGSSFIEHLEGIQRAQVPKGEGYEGKEQCQCQREPYFPEWGCPAPLEQIVFQVFVHNFLGLPGWRGLKISNV